MKLNKLDIDKANYRYLTFLELDANRDYTPDTFNMQNKLTRNVSTALQMYAVGGYDIAFDKIAFNQSNKLLVDTNSYAYVNAVLSDQVLSLMETNCQYRSKVIKQIQDNAIKYFIFTSKSKYIKRFEKVIESKDGLQVVSVNPFMKDSCILEISGVDSLCKNEMREKIKLEGTMGKLVMDRNNDSDKRYDLAFLYSDKYRIKFVGVDGNSRIIPYNTTEDGYITVNVSDLPKGKLILSYEDFVSKCAVGLAIVVYVLLLMVLLFSHKLSSKQF